MKTILCYGDSNTWGYVAGTRNYETGFVERFDRNTRWPAALQNKLGADYYVIEEGLNGRTTNCDDTNPPDRNGKNYLPSCLYSHAPIDLVILALGGNDLKIYFNKTPEQVGEGLSELIDIIQQSTYGADMQSAPKILIVSQPIPLPVAETLQDENGIYFLEGAIKKATQLVSVYQKIAQQKQCEFLDVTQAVVPSAVDGVHLDKAGHVKLVNVIHTFISSGLCLL